VALMGEDFRNRLKDGQLGFIEVDDVVEDDGYDSTEHDWYGEADQDPANDPSQEWTYVRDQAL
jgi:hypothetical protein